MWCLVGDASSAACRDFTSCRQLVQVGVSTLFNNISWLFPHSRQNVMLLLLFLSACCFFWFFIVRERVNINKTSVDLIEVNKSFEGAPSPSSFFSSLSNADTSRKSSLYVHQIGKQMRSSQLTETWINAAFQRMNVSFLWKNLLRAKGKKKH